MHSLLLFYLLPQTLLVPQNNFYTKLGQECVAAGCSVDLFLFPNTYIDVATVAEVPRMTGGSVYKYSYFQADLDGQRFMEDLRTNVMKPIAFDAIMRVRTSTGLFGRVPQASIPPCFFGIVDITQASLTSLALLHYCRDSAN